MQTISHLTFTMARVTSQSVEDAKAYQQAERAKVEQATGLVITDAGAHKPVQRIVLIPCLHNGCLYVAGGSDKARAFSKLERHLERKHGMHAPAEVA